MSPVEFDVYTILGYDLRGRAQFGEDMVVNNWWRAFLPSLSSDHKSRALVGGWQHRSFKAQYVFCLQLCIDAAQSLFTNCISVCQSFESLKH